MTDDDKKSSSDEQTAPTGNSGTRDAVPTGNPGTYSESSNDSVTIEYREK